MLKITRKLIKLLLEYHQYAIIHIKYLHKNRNDIQLKGQVIGPKSFLRKINALLFV